jgi:Domain of unknown function (DUF4265)
MTVDTKLVKVQFYEPDIGYENLWASPLGSDLYSIQSLPYFVYGISLHDVVRARPDPEGRLQFLEVAKASSNRALRARPNTFALTDKEGRALISSLRELGCATDSLPPRLIAVSVPMTVDLTVVTDFLTSNGVPWEYANPSSHEIDRSGTTSKNGPEQEVKKDKAN